MTELSPDCKVLVDNMSRVDTVPTSSVLSVCPAGPGLPPPPPPIETADFSALDAAVRDPTTWTILPKYCPNHLGLRYNAMPEHQMALITSGCG